MAFNRFELARGVLRWFPGFSSVFRAAAVAFFSVAPAALRRRSAAPNDRAWPRARFANRTQLALDGGGLFPPSNAGGLPDAQLGQSDAC